MGHVCTNNRASSEVIKTSNRDFLLFSLGAVISVALLYFALRDMSWRALGATLADVNIASLCLCAVGITVGILLRGWRCCLVAGRPSRMAWMFARATNLGILGNQLLPGRLGEFVRVFALARLLRTGLSESLSAIVLDRVVDLAVLFLSAGVVSLAVSAEVVPGSWMVGLGIVLVIVGVGLLLLRNRYFQSWLEGWSERWLHRWALSTKSFLLVFNGMVRNLSRPRMAISILGLAFLVWLSDCLVVTAVLWSVGLDLPLLASLLLWVLLAAGSALPSAPGYIGIYQLAAVWGLAGYGVPPHQSVAAALVLQVTTLVVALAMASPEMGMLGTKIPTSNAAGLKP